MTQKIRKCTNKTKERTESIDGDILNKI